MKAGCLLFFVSIAMIWGGGQGTYTALTNRSVHEYSIEDYIKNKPDDKWIKLTGGVLDLAEMSYSSSFGKGRIKELYLPIVPADADPEAKVHVLLSTKDPKLLELAEKMRDVKTEADALRFALENREMLAPKKDVQGVVQFGIDMKQKEIDKLQKLNPNLTENFIVLKDGEQPKFIMSLGFLLCGLLLLGWQIKRAGSASPEPPPPPPPYPSQTPPPIPPSP